jgi:hypothetical protein
MKIVELVHKLEQIEEKCKGEAREMCGKLIDDLIEWDMHLTTMMKKTSKKFIKQMEKDDDDFIKYLMKEGIDSGSIGEA